MRGADALIAALEGAGVDTVFGMPGGANLPLYDALLDSGIRHVLMRHEAGAGHAAEGYARATGLVGVAFATSGPGATNLVTPICDAHMDSIPTVFVTWTRSRPCSSPARCGARCAGPTRSRRRT
jgi:acetolactate synthase I/II/III large subunit